MKSIDLIAPAKTNLYLGIGRKRDDGYHDVTTVMHSLAMHDKLHMTLLSSGERTVLFEPCDAAQPLRQFEAAVEPRNGLVVSANTVWGNGIAGTAIPDENNLACRAVHQLASELGRSEDELMRIVIEKQIPHQSGLGGGSSDAAAALLGAANLWGLSADDPAIVRTAQALGADVCFFLYGGCVLLEGRGEEFVHALAPRTDSIVLIRPDEGVSTAKAYAMFDEDPVYPAADALADLAARNNAADIPLWNNLEAPAQKILPELAEIHAMASDFEGVSSVLMCGSGSATLAVCEDLRAAQALSAAAQLHGWWARTTSFAKIRAAILPERK